MWYVIQVYTGKEAEIVERCFDRVLKPGEDAFVMLGERKNRIRGEWTLVRYRLFPGYVFIETQEIEDFFLRLKKVKAMTKVLETDGYLTPVDPEEEAFLKMLGGSEHVAKYSEGYLEGEKLVVTDGALEGYEGKVKKLLRHQRLVVVELPLLGQMVEVTLGLGVVKRMEGQNS